MPDADRLAAVRAALPALDAGIYLNTGSVGPLPAETAAAMAELDGLRAATRAARSIDYFDEIAPAHGRGARRRRGRPRPPTSTDIALTHCDDRRHEHRRLVDRLAARRPRRHDEPRASRRRRCRCQAARSGSAIEIAFVDVGPVARRRRRSSRRSTRPSTTRTRLVAISHVLWATGRGPAGRADRRRSPMRAGRSSSSTARRPPAPSRSTSPRPGADVYAVPAQKWLLGPEGMGALAVAPGVARRLARQLRRATSPSRLGLGAGEPACWPDARRFEATELPPAVDRRHGPLDRLAEHVRRPRLGLRTRRGAGPLGGRPARRDRRRRASLTPRDRMATLVTFRIDGWPPQAALDELARAGLRDRPDGAARSTRSGSASASSTREDGARAVRRRRSSCWPRTRRRRSRRAGR